MIFSSVSKYVVGNDIIQARDFAAAPKHEENGPIESYSFPEERLQKVSEAESILEENYAVQSNGSLHSSMKPLQHDHLAVSVEDTVGEPQKHTYASIVSKTFYI